MERLPTVSGFDTAIKPGTRTFDIMSLAIGGTLEIETASGTRYWVTATRSMFSRYAPRPEVMVVGISVQTTPEVTLNFDFAPTKTYVGRYVTLGEPFALGEYNGHTSNVRGFRKL